MGVTLRGWSASPTAKDKYILVESEAEAKIAQGLLKQQILLWPSVDGALSFLEVEELMKLNGADVLLWPANTHGARQAMVHVANSLSRGTDRLRMIYVNGEDPHGFNATDVAGWDAPKLVEWAKTRARPYERQEAPDPIAELIAMDEEFSSSLPEKPAHVSRGTPRTRPDGSNPAGAQIEQGATVVSWDQLGLDRPPAGMPYPHLANAQRILANHPDLVGKIWYDEFHDKIFQTLFQDGAAEWQDHHDVRMTIWIQSRVSIPKMALLTVRAAVDEMGRLNVRNEPKDWMLGLTWDGTERLPTLMVDGWGTEQNEYTAAVGRCWMMSIVARIMDPGCQVDYMPVFEGAQGINKSTAIARIGGKWYAEAHSAVTSKDFFQDLQGKMLLEVSELHAFRREEVNTVKRVISCRTDRYRSSYGRRSADHPRQCVFAGTTNRDDWVADDTGARRFWPIACTEINLDYITTNRDQLFAEAVHRYQNGEKWWDVDQSLASAEQDARRELDLWTETILQWCCTREYVDIRDVLSMAIGIPVEKQGKVEQMRVGTVLRIAKWSRQRKRRDGKNTQFWFNPNPVGTVGTREMDF